MIEKNIFQSWKTKNLNDLIQQKINSYLTLNPGYKYKLYDDNDIDKFVNENYSGEIANCFNKLNIIVAKVDFWRYLILYKYGGIYLDMDSSIDKNLNELINDEDEAIISVEGNEENYVQWALIFKKGHPILKKTIEVVVENIKNNKYPNDIIFMTGPRAFAEGINILHKELFGNELIHKSINMDTDITYKTNNWFSNISYRIYSVDYKDFFTFKHEQSHLLYNDTIPWMEEKKTKNLLSEEINYDANVSSIVHRILIATVLVTGIISLIFFFYSRKRKYLRR
jgi:mannosyltransferase OCH1-like enzyme